MTLTRFERVWWVDPNAGVNGTGISSSPLIVGDLVIVAPSGTLVAYDINTGNQRWIGPSHGGSYSSPQLVSFDGVDQVVILSSPGAVSVKPSDGKLLWEHKWEGGAIVQPALTEDGDILINAMTATGGVQPVTETTAPASDPRMIGLRTGWARTNRQDSRPLVVASRTSSELSFGSR